MKDRILRPLPFGGRFGLSFYSSFISPRVLLLSLGVMVACLSVSIGRAEGKPRSAEKKPTHEIVSKQKTLETPPDYWTLVEQIKDPELKTHVIGMTRRISAHMRAGALDSANFLSRRLSEATDPSRYPDLWVAQQTYLAESLRINSAYESALSILHHALPVARYEADRLYILNRLGAVHYEIKNLDSAYYYSEKVAATYRQQGYPHDLTSSTALLQLGALHQDRGELHKALKVLKQAELADSLIGFNNRGVIQSRLAMVHLELGKHDRALWHSRRAYACCLDSSLLTQSLFILDNHEKILEANGLIKEALATGRLGREWTDRYRLVEQRVSLAEAEANHAESRKKLAEAELDLVKARYHWVGVALAGLVLLLVTVALFSLMLRQRSKQILQQNKALEQQRRAEHQARLEAERANQTKALLLSIISHDVRGPVGNLSETLQMINTGEFGPQETSYLINILTRDVADASSLLEDVLLWAKGQMGGIGAHPEPISPGQLVDEVWHHLRPQHKSRRVKLQTVLEGEPWQAPPMALADRGLLKICLRNVLANAIRYSAEGSTVTLTYRAEATRLQMEIRDQGQGLSDDVMAHLSEADSTISALREQRDPGNGLGLVLVRDFMRLQGGSMRLANAPEGGGRVILTLPLPAQPALVPAGVAGGRAAKVIK